MSSHAIMRRARLKLLSSKISGTHALIGRANPNFPRYRKLTVFHPDIPGTPIYRAKRFPPSIPVNRGPTVLYLGAFLSGVHLAFSTSSAQNGPQICNFSPKEAVAAKFPAITHVNVKAVEVATVYEYVIISVNGCCDLKSKTSKSAMVYLTTYIMRKGVKLDPPMHVWWSLNRRNQAQITSPNITHNLILEVPLGSLAVAHIPTDVVAGNCISLYRAEDESHFL
eukprot:sb/3469690/